MRIHKYISAALFISGIIFLCSCGGNNTPGRIYMPDMAYSRAYESYALRDSSKFTMDFSKMGGNMIFFNNMPPKGTIKRGDLFPYTLTNDSNGYKMSAGIKNPFDTIKSSKAEMTEAGRLFNINCAICHGATGEGNGPLSASGHIGGVANLKGGAAYLSMSDGTMFHSVTYGKGVMGSYASQLRKEQRWMVIKYIRTLQGGGEASKAGTDSTGKAGVKKDSAVAKK